MPSKKVSDDVLTKDTLLIYYLWKTRKKDQTISAIAENLGYPDDSSVNKRINKLVPKYLSKNRRDSNVRFKVTLNGKRKILYLILPEYMLASMIVLAFGYVWWGIEGMLFAIPIQAPYVLVTGLFSTVMLILVFWLYRTGENRLWQGYRRSLPD